MQLGTGTSISWENGFFAEVLDIRPPACTRGKVDTTHMLTQVARENLPTVLKEWGELEVDMAFDPAARLPMDRTPTECVITFPDGETWTFDGWMSRYEPTVPLEDKMTTTAALQVSGDVNIQGGSS